MKVITNSYEKVVYENEYNVNDIEFEDWCNENEISVDPETYLMDYIQENGIEPENIDEIDRYGDESEEFIRYE